MPVDGLLRSGENVPAVEVHNSRARSPDIPFDTRAVLETPALPTPRLGITRDGEVPGLNWTGMALRLQQADAPGGPWSDVPGPVTASPYRASGNTAVRYFRLLR